MNDSLVETLIGALVLAVAVVFLVFAYSSSGIGGGVSGYALNAKFFNAEGLKVGSDVRLSGVKVGSVTDQSLDAQTYQAVVAMTLRSEVQLPEDSVAKISSTGLLGDSYVALEPGGSETMMKPGATFQYTQGSVNLMDLISKAIFASVDSGAPAGGARPDGAEGGGAAEGGGPLDGGAALPGSLK